jgi:chaperone modulatory protein CbpM
MTTNFILATPQQVVDSFVVEEITELTLEDLCRACAAQSDIIIELVTEGVIDNMPMQQDAPPEHWRFTGLHLYRAKVAMRLHRDLGVNFAGAALALQLMDELDALQSKILTSAI